MDCYFTFGQVHIHRVNGKVFDKDCVVKIVATSSGEARQIMIQFFGDRWAFQYNDVPPDMNYFPRGIMEI